MKLNERCSRCLGGVESSSSPIKEKIQIVCGIGDRNVRHKRVGG